MRDTDNFSCLKIWYTEHWLLLDVSHGSVLGPKVISKIH